MTALLYILGVLLLLVGVGLSIGLHELGHLTFAKRFGVKVSHYMIGFGPTLFKFRRGETEYGVKLLPLGGFIAMPGMYPPKDRTNTRIGEDALAPVAPHALVEQPAGVAATQGPSAQGEPGGRQRRRRPFETTMAEARAYSNQDIVPGEEHRTFYALSVPKRLAVMFAGPAVNLVLGIIIMFIVLVCIGANLQPTTTVQTIVECAVPASQAQERQAEAAKQGRAEAACTKADPLTPAWQVGLRPGDRIVSIAGHATSDWAALGSQVRAAAGTTVPIVIERDGARQTLDVPVIRSEQAVTDESGHPVTGADGKPETREEGFLGISPTMDRSGIPVGEFPGQMGQLIGQTFDALIHLPQRLVAVGQVAFGDAERDENSPVGMVGVGRVAGEIVSSDRLDVTDKLLVGLNLLGGLNLFLFAFNMVPLLPLDGGHIAVALYEGARRRINLRRGRGVIGPFDTAKLLPLTYAVTGLMLCMTVLLVYVDIFKPIRLGL